MIRILKCFKGLISFLLGSLTSSKVRPDAVQPLSTWPLGVCSGNLKPEGKACWGCTWGRRSAAFPRTLRFEIFQLLDERESV